MWKSTGILRYSPKLLGGKSDKWWLVIDCEEEIGRFYRQLYYLGTYKTSIIMRPAWDSHVTVIRNEEPIHKQFWEKYRDTKIDLVCLPPVQTNGKYYWLNVECDKLYEIREELGLPRLPEIPFHLSIGHI